MSRDEVVENIGTIARSGTREFLRARPRGARQAAAAGADRPVRRGLLLELHGRRSHHGRHAARGRGGGHALGVDGRRRLHPRARPSGRRAGTTVTLHLKPKDEEDGLADYTQDAGAEGHRQALLRLRRRIPIRLGGETLNSMKAIWARGQGRGHRGRVPRVLQAHQPRLERPARAPARAHRGRASRRARCSTSRRRRPSTSTTATAATAGSQLYVKRVFIMDDWRGAAAAVPALRARRRRLRRPVAERLARDPPEGPPDPGHPQAPRAPPPRPPSRR